MLRFQGWILLSQCNQVVTLEFIVLLAGLLLVVHDVGHGLNKYLIFLRLNDGRSASFALGRVKTEPLSILIHFPALTLLGHRRRRIRVNPDLHRPIDETVKCVELYHSVHHLCREYVWYIGINVVCIALQLAL